MALVTEKIDERILSLLGLENEIELSYGQYVRDLKEALSVVSLGKSRFSTEEVMLLQEEFKRIRSKNKKKGDRFNLRVKKEKISASKVASSKFLKPTKKSLALLPPSATSAGEGIGGFFGIKKTLDSISKTLESKFKFDKKQEDQDRKGKETERRGKKESSLEGFKKGVAGIVATTKKMLDPFQSIIDRIWKFIFFTLLGRAFTKFMDWMKDKGNQEKFNSFIEFLSDHFPAIVGLYILFGTSFGKLVRGLLKGVTRMTVALLTNIPKIRSFIKKNPKLSGLLLTGAAAASGAVSRQIQDLFADKPTPEAGLIPTKNPELDQAKQEADKAANTKVSKLNFGGMVPKFNVGGMLPSFAMGGFNPYGGIPITGAGQDDTLIAAKTGEAILTEKDQTDLSQRYVDRTTGQPLNVPQYLAGRKPGSVSMGNLRFPGFGGGFFNGGMIPKFNTGGIVGMQGGGAKVGAQNSRVVPIGNRAVTATPRVSLVQSIQEAQKRLLDRTALTNTNIRHTGIRPWWERVNPFIDKREFAYRLPSHDPSMRNYNMPGYNRNRWFELDKFRTRPEEYKSNPKSPKLKYASPAYIRPGIDKPLALQGGGLMGGLDSFGRSVFENVGGSVGRNKGRQTGVPGGGWFGEQLGERKGRKIYEQLTNPLRRQGVGGVKENTGLNIHGATADRQLAALQPGEYVLPVDTVNRLGTSLIDKLVAMTDSNSNPYLGRGTVRRPQITPYNTYRSNSNMITLPPIKQSMGETIPQSSGFSNGTKSPSFSAISPSNDRAINASIYGLIG